MFRLYPSQCNESPGSNSKLRRRPKAKHTFCKTSRRVLRWIVRDGPVLSVLLFTTTVVQLGQRLRHNGSFFERISTNIESAHDHHAQNIMVQQTFRPPSYLPLAQHLRHINMTKNSPSLQDMTYGVQRNTQPDLKPTSNKDLDSCGRCKRNSKCLLKSTFLSPKTLKLARTIAKIVTFYDVSTMLVLPCAEEVHWILPLVKVIRVCMAGSPAESTHILVASAEILTFLCLHLLFFSNGCRHGVQRSSITALYLMTGWR